MLARVAFVLPALLLIACEYPGAPTPVQVTTPRPGLSSVARIESLQVMQSFGFPGPPPEVVAPEPDGSVFVGPGSYSVRVNWFNPQVSGRYVQVSATGQPDGALTGFLTKTWPEDAYSATVSALPGTDGWQIVVPSEGSEARVTVELLENGPDLPLPQRVQRDIIVRRR